jgi:hypothetical protein
MEYPNEHGYWWCQFDQDIPEVVYVTECEEGLYIRLTSGRMSALECYAGCKFAKLSEPCPFKWSK